MSRDETSGAFEIEGPSEFGILKISLSQVGLTEVGFHLEVGAGEVGPLEVGPVQVGPLEVGLAQVGPLEVGLAQVGLLEVGPAQVGPRPLFTFRLNPPLVLVQNLHQLLFADFP